MKDSYWSDLSTSNKSLNVPCAPHIPGPHTVGGGGKGEGGRGGVDRDVGHCYWTITGGTWEASKTYEIYLECYERSIVWMDRSVIVVLNVWMR